MKHLHKRNEFLYNKSNFEKDIQSSTIIKEATDYMYNVTRFGDTMIGRLFNSTWQLARWAVKAYQITGILRELEANLQNLIDRVDMVQVTKEFPLLTLKLQLERIKTVCTSTATEEQKLNQLIGWDGRTIMFDTANPKADIPFIYDGQSRRILTLPVPLAQEVYDNINEPITRERMEDVKGPQVVKAFLDALSNFMDECRKLTLPAGVNKPDFSTNIFTFNQELQEILARVVRDVKELSNESNKFRVVKYYTFLNEDNSSQDSNVNSLEMIAKKIQSKIESDPKSDITKSKEYQQLFDILNKLNDEQKTKIQSDIEDLEDLTGKEVVKSQDVEAKSQPQVEKPQVEKPVDEVPKQKAEPVKPVTKDVPSQPQPQKPVTQPQKEVKPEAVSKQPTPPQKEVKPEIVSEQPTPPPTKEPSEVESNKPTPPQQKVEVEKKPIEEKPTEVVEKDEEQIEELYNSKYGNYISLILEEAPKLFPDVKTASFGANRDQDNPTTVRELWNYLFEEIDRVVPAEMTQEEVERLTSYDPPRVDAAYNFVQNPDPLIRIVRIFEKANSIYTQPMIPSGRMNGEVDSEVYRRFIYVGNSTPGTRERPGYGPWVQKYQFRQWTNGVYEMMESARFRDIFKNVQNVIPESIEYKQILEAEETKPGETKKTPFEIIKEFILDALNIKNQGDFSKYESEAMKRYFGINVKPQQLVSEKPANIQQAGGDNSSFRPDTFVWERFAGTSFTNGEMGEFFAFPIEHTTNNNPHRMMFLQPIDLLDNGRLVTVKFTFDHQTIVDRERQLPGRYRTIPTVVSNWSCNQVSGERTDRVYYGLMVNEFTQNFTMCWVNCSESNINNPLPTIQHGRIDKRADGNTRINGNQDVPTTTSRLVYYDAQTQRRIVGIAMGAKIGNELDYDDLDTWQNALSQLRQAGGPQGHRYWT